MSASIRPTIVDALQVPVWPVSDAPPVDATGDPIIDQRLAEVFERLRRVPSHPMARLLELSIQRIETERRARTAERVLLGVWRHVDEPAREAHQRFLRENAILERWAREIEAAWRARRAA